MIAGYHVKVPHTILMIETGESEFLKELEHTQGYATGNPDKLGATSKLDGRGWLKSTVYYTKPDNTVKR